MSHTDLTAGGCATEFPQWQIDENVVISSLSKDFRTLDNQTNAGIHNFKDFTTFLQNHDENVVTAFKWFLETIKRFHENPEKSRYRQFEDRYSDYYTSNSCPLIKRYIMFNLLIIAIA